MEFELMKDGRPDQNLGISHTLRHYLNPREMWQDLAEDLDEALQPRPVSLRLEGAEAETHWKELRTVYHRGYGALLKDWLACVPDPHQDPQRWVRYKGSRATELSSGVIVRLIHRHGQWQLYTAFRPVDYKLLRYDYPPQDDESVRRRRLLASFRSKRWMALRRAEERL